MFSFESSWLFKVISQSELASVRLLLSVYVFIQEMYEKGGGACSQKDMGVLLLELFSRTCGQRYFSFQT